jgi:hypothetical protein
MLARLAKGSGLVAVGLALMVGQGCKKKQVPAAAQPVVRTVPRPATPDFPDGPPQTVVLDQPAHHSVRRAAPAPVVRASRPVVDQAALDAAQRQKDAVLLQSQQAASQRQQQELNGVVQRSYKFQQDQQAEPRIQEAPEVPINQPLPGFPNQRIQDNPSAPQQQQAEPEQPAQPDDNGADQTNPPPPQS